MSGLEETIAKFELLRLHSNTKKVERLLERITRLKKEIEAATKTHRLISYLSKFVSLEEHYAETLEMVVNNLGIIPDLPAIEEAIDNVEGRYKFVMELFQNLVYEY